MTVHKLYALFLPEQRLPKLLNRLAFAAAFLAAAFAGGDARAQVAGAIAVYPLTSTVEIGSTLQCTAYVPISPNTVTWAVNDIVGGNSTVGTVSQSGLYTPPAVAPTPNIVTIKVRSVPYPNSFGTNAITVTRPYPWLWSVYPTPSPLKVGNYTVSLNGSAFQPDSIVLADGNPLPTTYFNATKLTATGTAAAVGKIVFSVKTPGPGQVIGNTVSVNVQATPVTVAVSPTSATVQLGNSQSFTSTVTGNTNTSVTWSVNGVVGGSATTGTITPGGVFTAPAALPNPATVTVRATSVASTNSYAQATITLIQPLPQVTVDVQPASASLIVNGTKQFAATVTGSANQAVTWSVNGVNGGSSVVGTINSAGLYTAPGSIPNPNTLTIRATSQANPAGYAQATVTITSAPSIPQTWITGARFLDQTSFGPTPAELAKIQQMGIPSYLDDQFNQPETQIPQPADNGMGTLRNWQLYNFTTAPDQLRQRVAYALSQIIVTSGNKLVYADEIIPWMKLLSHEAFGNYRQLLRDVSICPSMGKYLDLAKSTKPMGGSGANENYARELMQLFSIGLWELNQDGSQKLDASNKPIPTYNQTTVQQVALALTGWDYANNAYENFTTNMVAYQSRHDTNSHVYLGTNSPAGLTVDQDLDFLIATLMNHPNIAPFISTRLIRSLVKSNPTPGYIQRVADVFCDNGQGVKGDLKAVVTAILMDAEARNDNASVNDGRLKDPILHISAFLRALGGAYTPGEQLTYIYDYMSQMPLGPASVFSWFSPLYRVPKMPQLFGPEFQIYSPSEAVLRGNMFFYFLSNQPGADFTIDLAQFQPYGSDMPALVELCNQKLLYGRMPAAMKQIIIDAATQGWDSNQRIQTAIYLTALSGQYAVQY